jgi:hypothetical protein
MEMMMLMKMTTYLIPSLTYEDGSLVTFEADDTTASKVPIKRLLYIGECDAEFRKLAHPLAPFDRHPEEALHRWAWAFARRKFTTFDELRDQFSCVGQIQRIDALTLGVAAWIKTRWPQLEIKEHRTWDGLPGGFTEGELAAAAKDLTALPPVEDVEEAAS